MGKRPFLERAEADNVVWVQAPPPLFAVKKGTAVAKSGGLHHVLLDANAECIALDFADERVCLDVGDAYSRPFTSPR